MLIVLAVLSVGFRWWGPLILAPLFWQLWDTVFGRRGRIHTPILQLVGDLATYSVWVSYMAFAVFSIGRNVGHWYGWTIGAVVGVSVAQVFGLLFPFRWHLERADVLWGKGGTRASPTSQKNDR